MKMKVELFRYYRPLQLDETRLELQPTPKGGITFHFDIDQLNDLLTVRWAICPDTENFSYEIGKNVINGRRLLNDPKNEKRFRQETVLFINYDRNVSLQENVIDELDGWAASTIKGAGNPEIWKLYQKWKRWRRQDELVKERHATILTRAKELVQQEYDQKL